MRRFLSMAVVGALCAGVAVPAWGWEDYEPGEAAQQVTVPAGPRPSDGLPIFGIMADVGVPDGLMGALAIRPWSWLRLSGGGGTNSISHGWRTGVTLLPFVAGPTASFEYGRYSEGNANSLAKKFVGSSFDGSPLLERVGYEFMNAHLGLDFGSSRVVFFVHGGMTLVRSHIRNVETAIRDSTGKTTGTTGSTEVVVGQDPKVKAIGSSVKLGLIAYVW
jgi:hypothetical protein